MRFFALLAIRFYQRFLSPYKGFCCAYGVHTGYASCSVLGYRAVRRFGVWHGVQVLDARLLKCGVAYQRQRAALLSRQAGSCDLPCSLDVGDCLDLGDCCDWRSKKNPPRTTRRPPDPHIPPRRQPRR